MLSIRGRDNKYQQMDVKIEINHPRTTKIQEGYVPKGLDIIERSKGHHIIFSFIYTYH